MKHVTEKNYLFVLALMLTAGPTATALAWIAADNNRTDTAKYPLDCSWDSDEDDYPEEEPDDEPKEPEDEPEEPDDEPEEPDDEPPEEPNEELW